MFWSERIRQALRLGSYGPAEGGVVRYACVDVDGSNKSKGVADALAAALRIAAAFRAAGLPCHLEKSKSGKGWHLWVFFSALVPADLVRLVLLSLIPKDIPLEGGGFADAGRNRGVELFPKRADLNTPRRTGNQVWLPWWHGAEGDNNQFHRETAPGVVYPDEPDELETADVDVLERLAAPLLERREAEKEARPEAAPRGRERRPRAGRAAGAKYDGEREAEPIDSILIKAFARLHESGQRHNETVWLASQLRDNYHDAPDGYDEAVEAVKDFAREFPAKDGEPYGEAEALADLDDVWPTPPRNKSGRRKKKPPEAAPADDAEAQPPPPPDPQPPWKPPAPPFTLGLSLPPPAKACPYCSTARYSDAADPAAVRVASRACGKMKCVVCRKRKAFGHLKKAERGMAAALAAGMALAVASLAGVSAATLRQRLKCVGGRYVNLRLNDETLSVCALAADAEPPKGFAKATPKEAADAVRAALEWIEEANPYAEDEIGAGGNPFKGRTPSGKRWQPITLGKEWRGGPPHVSSTEEKPLQTKREEARQKPSAGGRKWKPAEVLAVQTPEAVVELLRRFEIASPLVDRPPPWSTSVLAWGVEFSLDGLDGPTRTKLLDALRDLPPQPPPEPEMERGGVDLS